MSDTAAAKTDAASNDKPGRQREAVDKCLAAAPVRTTGRVSLEGRHLDYRVEAGFVPVVSHALDEHRGEPLAAIFTTAYLLDQELAVEAEGAEAPPRPVCFAFNGGPGSASIWLHLGALGPKRVRIRNDGSMPRPPYAVEDNALTWLGHFDLVFIDPPHTGFSITASDDARKKALTVDGDIEMMSDVIRHWLSRHGRWNSPVYVAGESYGTTRGAGIADKLAEAGVPLSGLILVSCAMDLQSIVFAPRNDLPYALFLPAFAMTAQYHGCLKGPMAGSRQAALDAAREYAEGEYLRVLHRGGALTEGESRKAARRIGELTGLSATLVEHKNLRITDSTFFTELLRERGQIVGRLESRVTGPMGATRAYEWDFDPGIEALAGPFTMAGLGYFTQVLGFDRHARYETLSMDVHKTWNWNRGEQLGNGYTCTSSDLSRAMRRNPHLRVFVASGHYDLGTPSTASDWSLAQLDIPPDVRARITHRYYDAGHMMYTRDEDLAQMERDLAAWLADDGAAR
jgi:carboxypeptidase C (cathepsin A)